MIQEIQKGISEVTLSEPIEEGDNVIEKITFRNQLTWGDTEVFGKEDDNKIAASIDLFSRLTLRPEYHVSTLKKINFKDAEEIMDYLAKIIGGGDSSKKKAKTPSLQ